MDDLIEIRPSASSPAESVDSRRPTVVSRLPGIFGALDSKFVTVFAREKDLAALNVRFGGLGDHKLESEGPELVLCVVLAEVTLTALLGLILDTASE